MNENFRWHLLSRQHFLLDFNSFNFLFLPYTHVPKNMYSLALSLSLSCTHNMQWELFVCVCVFMLFMKIYIYTCMLWCGSQRLRNGSLFAWLFSWVLKVELRSLFYTASTLPIILSYLPRSSCFFLGFHNVHVKKILWDFQGETCVLEIATDNIFEVFPMSSCRVFNFQTSQVTHAFICLQIIRIFEGQGQSAIIFPSSQKD